MRRIAHPYRARPEEEEEAEEEDRLRSSSGTQLNRVRPLRPTGATPRASTKHIVMIVIKTSPHFQNEMKDGPQPQYLARLCYSVGQTMLWHRVARLWSNSDL